MQRRTAQLLTASLLALAAGGAPAAAQPRAARSLLVVRVLDERGRGLAGAAVTVGGVRGRETTDGAGEARFTSVAPGNRLVEVRRPGYAMVRLAADFAGA